jgi:outer membrane protein OmpA-like peptidoglycan-associated protein
MTTFFSPRYIGAASTPYLSPPALKVHAACAPRHNGALTLLGIIMKTFAYPSTLLIIVAALAGCSSLPTTTALLDQTRNDYLVANANGAIQRNAPSELEQAQDALKLANAAAARNATSGEIDELAYLAKQKIALSVEVSKRRSAEVALAEAGKQQMAMRLEQRIGETNRANMETEQQRNLTVLAQTDAANSRRSAESAQQQSDTAWRQTADARDHATQLEQQLSDLKAKQTPRGLVITLSDVLFSSNSSTLTSVGLNAINRLADVLNENPHRRVQVEGFTDNVGSARSNEQLSDRRASAVRNALTTRGISGDRIQLHGYGEANPVADNNTESNRQLNRRVEIVLSDDSGLIPVR